MNMEESAKIMALVVGATGFWKLLEMLFERGKYRAEINQLNAQVHTQIISNWVSWSQKLEERVRFLENHNEEQRKQIEELELQVTELEKQNESLRDSIAKFNYNEEKPCGGISSNNIRCCIGHLECTC